MIPYPFRRDMRFHTLALLSAAMPSKIFGQGWDQKIFVIGCNKTGTSSFSILFWRNRLSAQHATKWKTDKYQCFSDNGNLQNIKELRTRYPTSLFILNTRRLDDWLVSRFLHGIRFSAEWANRATEDKVLNWSNMRRNHHRNVLECFQDSPRQLCVISIDAPYWSHSVTDFCGLKRGSDVHAFATPARYKKAPLTDFVGHTLKKFGYTTEDFAEQLFPDYHEALTPFRNNFAHLDTHT